MRSDVSKEMSRFRLPSSDRRRLLLKVPNIVMSLTNSSSTVKFSSLTALTAAQKNFTEVEVHAYDLRDSSTSSPITDTRLGN